MLTGRQCRAARGLLNWSQANLAKACGLSKTSINNFESGETSIKQSSEQSILKSFDQNNVEFLPNEGVHLNENRFQIFRGDNSLIELWNDILNSFGKDGGEILIKNVDEEQTIKEHKSLLKSHINNLKKHNITERLLASEEATKFPAPKEWYRLVSTELFDYASTTFIYNGKAAFRIRKSKTIILINDVSVYEAEKDSFNNIWNNAKII